MNAITVASTSKNRKSLNSIIGVRPTCIVNCMKLRDADIILLDNPEAGQKLELNKGGTL